ncbi:MAG: helix-turn-helix domain containing protein [Enterocloster clostridioformis]|uniref:helix-turn-helix domain-containing protein n=1 Tax=Enterocloster clostridioformis TaxID=1531 RepID=UPI00242ACABC|nr:helix-turn-helix domain-containing protein [Enterocloster clostridioformis]MCI6124636.1 helix-turn-helix domain containing protein [Enterocloster clostridioformis]MDY4764902.1 helix-turn-helix domain-containing protein [Enterocloster clostridioformis]
MASEPTRAGYGTGAGRARTWMREEVRPMKQTEALEEVARLAAREVLKEHERQTRREKKVKVFQNTKKLMENYNRICQSVEEGVAELSDMDNGDELEEFTEEDIFINSILKSKLRSIVMIGHIDKCLKLLEDEECRKNTHEKYLAFKYFYLDGMTYESIAEIYGYGERTARRWITELTGILSVYLFGADALMLD